MRAGVLPYEEVTPEDCLTKNILGGNSGNLLYQYSMIKTLSTENTEVIPSRYQIDLNLVDWLNEECSAFVIPLADAFRNDFRKEMRELTELVKRLKIPCIIAGVGVRAAYEPDFTQSLLFDEDVKNLVNAVLEKSPIIGLRGELTGEYLKKLGYQEEKDFTVIGCPSLYMNGEHMQIREVDLNPNSKVSISSIRYAAPELDRFIDRLCDTYENHRFVGQLRQELRLLYTGYGFYASSLYPCKNCDSKDYINGKARFFINVPSWLDYMKQMDLAVGGRFHGTVSGLVAGTPSILIANDARKREFMMYHKMPGIPAHEVTDDLTLEELVESADFKVLEANHKKNFERFISFLKKCGLETIYTEPQKEDYFQEKMNSVKLNKGVEPLLQHSNETFHTRTKNSYNWLLDTQTNLITNNSLLLQWVKLKNKGKSTLDYFKENGYQKIGLYGINEFAHLLYEELSGKEEIQMQYIIEPKSGQVFHNLKVQTLEESDLSFVDILVVNKIASYSKLKEQLSKQVKVVSLADVISTVYRG